MGSSLQAVGVCSQQASRCEESRMRYRWRGHSWAACSLACGLAWIVAWIVACVAAVLCAPRARAQDDLLSSEFTSNALPQPIVLSRRLPLQIDSVGWGWTGTALHAERHSPVRITFSSGNRAISGLVSLVYPQDGTQNARISVPFTTTPDVGTTVELQACPTRGTTQMRLEVMAEGRTFVRRLDSPVAASPDDIGMPVVAMTPVWIAVGPDLVLNRFDTIAITPTSGEPRQYWSATAVPTVPARNMSDAWMAYESVDGVVARERDLRQLTSVQRDALRIWLENGGRMVIALDEVGGGWREWLPEFLPDDFLDVSEVQRVIPGQGVRDVLLQTESDGAGGAAREWAGAPATGNETPATQVRSRVITISDTAHSLGWRGFWELEGDAPASTFATSNHSTMGATGPVGLGVLTLLGVDPANLPAFMNATQSDRAWRDAMDRTRDRSINAYQQDWRAWDWNQGDATATGQAADSIILAATPGTGFFIIVMLAIFALALWLGPVGRLVLRRKGWLSRNWAIALGAIGVCTLVGLLAPRLFRDGTDDLGTLTLHDVFVDPEGKPLRVYTSTLHTAFAGSPETFDLAAIDLRTQDARGQWWRGVSPVRDWWDARLKQGATAQIVNVPGVRGSQAAGVLTPVEVAQWTLRVFLAQYPGREARGLEVPTVRVLRSPRDSQTRIWRDNVVAVIEPRDGRATGYASMQFHERHCRPASSSVSDGTLRVVYSPVNATDDPLLSEAETFTRGLEGLGASRTTQTELGIVNMLALQSRQEVIRRMSATGDYAAVLVVEQETTRDRGRRSVHKTVYRIIAPVAVDVDRPPPPPDETTLPEELP
jgi:uncharacterized membrane protein